MKQISKNWERYLFAILGCGFMIASVRFLIQEKIAFFSTTFAVSFFCFFYANLARFKRFKGLGFEAELWEDKQKEAAALIERLKSLVTVYTTEIITSRVMRGRWSDGEDWQSHWSLFEEFVSRHEELGQRIDFAPLKDQLDSLFLLDIANHLQEKILKPIEDAKIKVAQNIATDFGNPVKDPVEHERRLKKLQDVPGRISNLFELSASGNVVRKILDNAMLAAERLKCDFGVEVNYDPGVLEDLGVAANAADHRPVVVTSKLIQLADREGE